MKRKEEIKLKVLSNIAITEPFFVLVANINWKQKEELEIFVNALCEMVEEKQLIPDTWDTQENKQNIQDDFENILWEYINKRLGNGENLDGVPGKDDVEFTITQKGVELLEELEKER